MKGRKMTENKTQFDDNVVRMEYNSPDYNWIGSKICRKKPNTDAADTIELTNLKICDTDHDTSMASEKNISSEQRNCRQISKCQEDSFIERDNKRVICTNTLPTYLKLLPKTQSLDIGDGNKVSNYTVLSEYSLSQSSSGDFDHSGAIPKLYNNDQTRSAYPLVNPLFSPFSSPKIGRRRAPLRDTRRVSIENNGSFIFLNQYKLMDEIGQGSYGLVKLAYSEEDSTHYAMKILSKKKLLKKAGFLGRLPRKGAHVASPLERVYREIAVLKKLDHPNVVKLIEVLDDPIEDSLYLVFELVKQGEILSIPTERPLLEDRAWSVFRDALQGIEYLHYQKIIHGDIKPANLLLTESGRVKVADLGVCNEFIGEDSINNGSSSGTPAFRAPETLSAVVQSYSGKAVDIWALGITLYALIYGNVPFLSNSVPLVYEKIKNENMNFPCKPETSDELKRLISGILIKDPYKRLTLPNIKIHPWITCNGKYCLPSEDENCRLIQVSDEEMNNAVSSIPKLDTLILIKTMLKKHSFQNPFCRGISGRAPQRGGSKLERFSRSGRSNSAPGAYHTMERNINENCLPSVSESTATSTFMEPEI